MVGVLYYDGMLKEQYISVDVEAAGPIPGTYSLLAIGACVVGNLEQSFYSELAPINRAFVAGAMAVHGLSMEKLQESGEAPAVAMARFEQWITHVSDEGWPVFVAFNATFDWMFVHWYFVTYLGRDPFGISGLDIKAYAMGKHQLTWGETVKKNVKKLYPTNQPHTHNALDDAREQADLFAQMIRA